MRPPMLPLAVVAFGLFVAFSSIPADAAVTSEFTGPPVDYGFVETVRIHNDSSQRALDVTARVILLPPKTIYSRVRVTRTSIAPTRTIVDADGNTVGLYQLSGIAAHGTATIIVHFNAISQAIAYRLPSTTEAYDTHSALYETYTNPRFEYQQGVNTDAPPVKAVVTHVTRGITSPVARARALFVWETHHIRYSTGQHASGGAVATLRTRIGICSDFAELYAALLRTDHIPARLISGYVTNNGAGQAGFHQWDEFYLPQDGWVVADPTWGRFGYFGRLQDNWHIALYAGTVPDVQVGYRSRDPEASLKVDTVYQFVKQSLESTAPPRHRGLPVLSVAPSHNTVTRQSPDPWWRRILRSFADFVAHLFSHLRSWFKAQ